MKMARASASAASSRISHIVRHSNCALLLAAALLAGCVAAPTPPVPQPPVAAPAPGAATAFERATFDALPATVDENWIGVWPAFRRSCTVLSVRAAWRDVCAQSQLVDARSPDTVRAFFAARFDVYRLRAQRADGPADTGLVTGYYEPALRGARLPSTRYHVPLHKVPADLVAVDLAAVHPEVAGLRLRGRLEGRRVVPYATRSQITAGELAAGNELLWVDDPVEAFFLQVQGSGRVALSDGTVVRVGYADSNGHPYRSIGRWLVEQGELPLTGASMQGIKAWVARNPQRLKELLDRNPSYVFFRELPIGDPGAGPIGALGVPLTPGHSVAVDPRHVPLGAPLLLSTVHPTTAAPLVRPMVAQDTGSAIRGPLRFDLFWGFGDAAGSHAGRQRHHGAAWVLVPKGELPETLLQR